MEAVAAAAAFAQLSELIYKCVKKCRSAFKRLRDIHATFERFSRTLADFRHLLSTISSTINEMSYCNLPALQDNSVIYLMKSIVKTCSTTISSIGKLSQRLRHLANKRLPAMNLPRLLMRLFFAHELRDVEKEIFRLEPIKIDIILFTTTMNFRSKMERLCGLRAQGQAIPVGLVTSV